MKPLSRYGSDEFQTPAYAILPLLKYIKKDWVVWECACGFGNLVKAFREHGYECIGTDESFFTYEPPHYDVIITNPPYSIKTEFLERAYSLKKPFAFLLPITALETSRRQALYKEYGLELILPDCRIQFESPELKKQNVWFYSAWFTHGLNIGHELNFERIR